MSELNQTQHKLKQFKNKLKNSLFVSPEDLELFEQVPDDFFGAIFQDNFNGDLSLATKILFEEYNDISYDKLRKELKAITNYAESVELLSHYIRTGKKVVFVTDIDNDGSLSQAILLEFQDILGKELSKNIDVLYTQVVNGNAERGFTVDLMELWAKEEGLSPRSDFLMLTADNGINSLGEQEKILSKFPHCKMLITDHHLPDPELVVKESSQCIIFNPKYKPSAFFIGKKNISGAHTMGVLCEGVIEKLDIEADLRNMHNLEYVSNLLDYVSTDIRFKPLETYLIEQFASLGTLLNVNNSLSKLITDNVDISDMNELADKIEGFSKDDFVEILLAIKEQNVLSSKLLYIKDTYDSLSEEEKKSFADKDFYLDYLDTIYDEDKMSKKINNNYVEQLRPFIYHTTITSKKTSYEVALLEKMVDVFSSMKKCERSLMNLLKNADIMDYVTRENVSIMMPKHSVISKVFNRKFLSKTFNISNPGFQLLLNDLGNKQWSGSFRGLYDSVDLLTNINKLEAQGTTVRFKGHLRAAGFELNNDNGVSLETVNDLADYVNGEITVLKDDVGYDEKYVLIEFENFNLVKEINNKVKAPVNNMSSIRPVIKLNRSLFFNEDKTLKPISIGQMLKKNKFGYTTIKLNFHDDAIIVPTEVVRQLADNNFKDLLEISTLNDGVFIANRVIPISSLKKSNIIRLHNKSKEKQKVLSEYFENEFHNKDFIKDIDRNKLKEIPIFARQMDAEGSFNKVEELFISLIDKYDLDKYVVLDTEANGLGKAPKLFNFGALEVSIKEGSGTIYTEDEWVSIMQDPIQKKLFEKNLKNIKFDEATSTFIVNREIEGKLVTALLNEKDFKLTPEISALTGISQAMLNKYGMNPSDFDKMITKHYEGQNLVFQAHNANYDLGVLNASAPKLKTEIIDKNLVCDSAKFAKEYKLAYGDVDVSIISSKFRTAFFFDDPITDYNLTNVIKADGDFQFPDIRGDFLLKRKNEKYSIVNLKKNIEYDIDDDKEELLKGVKRTTLPLNMVKYSVVSLLKYDNIRNMLLKDVDENVKNIETPNYIPEKFDELFQEFCNKDTYSFDMSPQSNFKVFEKRLRLSKRGDEVDELFVDCEIPVIGDTGQQLIDDEGIPRTMGGLEDKVKSAMSEVFVGAAKAFLLENKEVHTKYVSPWEYIKVLNNYDPTTSVITKDQVSGLSYKTGLPEDRIKKMVQEIYQYKKEMGINGEFFVPELHNNIDERGDAPLEAMVVFLRLATQTGALAEDIVFDTIEDTTRKNMLKTIFENEAGRISQNSYSAAQYRSFANRRDSEGNLCIAPSVDHAKNNPKLLMKSKLIPTGTHIIGEMKPDKELTINEMEEVERKFNFLIVLGLIKNSSRDFNISKEAVEYLGTLPEEDVQMKINDLFNNHKMKTESLDYLMDNAEATAELYKKDLDSIFGRMHYSREEYEMKIFAKDYWDFYLHGVNPTKVLEQPYYYKEDHKEIYLSLIDKYKNILELMDKKHDPDTHGMLSKVINKYVPSEIPELSEFVDTEKKFIFKFLTTDINCAPLVNVSLRQQVKDDLLLSMSKESHLQSKVPLSTDGKFEYTTEVKGVKKVIDKAQKDSAKKRLAAEKKLAAAEKKLAAAEKKRLAAEKKLKK
jgi:DNA polymerase III epsilon subunit-like protein